MKTELRFKNISDQTVQILHFCVPKVKQNKTLWSVFILIFIDSLIVKEVGKNVSPVLLASLLS